MNLGYVDVLIDGQAGSCGKGKFAGYLAMTEKYEAAISNAMPNSGHICEGYKFRNIPISTVNKNMKLFIGAGSAIDMEVLVKEYESLKDLIGNREILVHPRVPLIENRHKEIEKKLIKSGSTFTGGGACLAEKIMRSPDLKFFQGYKNIKVCENFVEEVNEILDKGGNILIEGSQGADLDINNGTNYPHVTSRQCSASQMIADSGISPVFVKDIFMIIRPYPIRISNETELGVNICSGDYGKSKELNWEDVNFRSGAATGHYVYDESDYDEFEKKDSSIDFTEFTTVTQKTRRVFELDIDRLKHNVKINRPTRLYLNFVQYLDHELFEIKGEYNYLYIDKYVREYINWIESELSVPITLLGTGAGNEYVIEKDASY